MRGMTMNKQPTNNGFIVQTNQCRVCAFLWILHEKSKKQILLQIMNFFRPPHLLTSVQCI